MILTTAHVPVEAGSDDERLPGERLEAEARGIDAAGCLG